MPRAGVSFTSRVGVGVAVGSSSSSGSREGSTVGVVKTSSWTVVRREFTTRGPFLMAQEMPRYSPATTARHARQNRENPTGWPMRRILLLFLICFICTCPFTLGWCHCIILGPVCLSKNKRLTKKIK